MEEDLDDLLSDAEFLRDLAERIYSRLTPAMGFDQYDSDRLRLIARSLED